MDTCPAGYRYPLLKRQNGEPAVCKLPVGAGCFLVTRYTCTVLSPDSRVAGVRALLERAEAPARHAQQDVPCSSPTATVRLWLHQAHLARPLTLSAPFPPSLETSVRQRLGITSPDLTRS